MRVLLALLFLLSGSFPVFGAESVDTPDPPDITQNMALIPAGSFIRGCDSLGPEHGAPQLEIYLDSFLIDQNEVTNQALEKIMPDHKLRRSVLSKCDTCPVSKITWYEAAEYCYLIGKSLPTEAQWEKAAGAANGCEFPWGPDFNSEYAHGNKKLKDGASPVGSYKPNRYGLHDMAGNLWEWVSDWYSQAYYFMEILYNPRGPNKGVMKVRRGGAWSDSEKGMRAGYRDWSYPFSRSYSDIGFRCAISLKSHKQ